MRRQIRQSLTAIVLTVGVLIAAPSSLTAQVDARAQYQEVVRRPIPRGAAGRTLNFARTELFFGTAQPDGGAVTEGEFRDFLDQEITPRFPDGLTLLKGYGQFLGEDGMIVNEDSYLLILLYPVTSLKQSGNRIEAIRGLYKTQFQQESVLRVDDPSVVHVSF